MEIAKVQDGASLTLMPAGRLDTLTSPEFEAVLKQNVAGITTLTLDLAKLDYISSAGLRILLAAQKLMAKQGTMRVVNVNAGVMEVFEMTGFADILSIEK